MAQTLPLSLAFNQCLGGKEDPYAFSSVHLEDLRSGKLEHLVTRRQLVDAIPKTVDPASRFTLRGQVSPAKHPRLPHSIKAALWWLVPSNGEFQQAPNGTHYYLVRQGLRVVLRGGDVTQTLFGSLVNWIPDPRDVNVTVRDSMRLCDIAETASVPSGAPLTPSLPKKCRRRRRRQARRAANQNRAPSSAAPVTPDERWANERGGSSGATQPRLEDSDPTSRMLTAVYPHPSIHSRTITQPPISTANENLLFHLGLELGEFPGLYKPAVPDPRQDSTARPFRVNNSGSSLSSPSHLQPHTKPFSGRPARPYMTCPTREARGASRERRGIVYQLMPRTQRPDTNVAIDAALPEAAAVRRQELPPTIVEIGTTRQPPTDSLPGSPPESAAVIALQECSGRPSARRLRNTGVIKITPCYKQLNK